MPRVINHKERRDNIIAKAFTLLASRGYQNVNLELIAKHCHISRPTIYTYFKDKRELFREGTREFTNQFFERYQVIALENEKSAEERLKNICENIIIESHRHSNFVTVLADYLFYMKRCGVDVARQLRRRTIRLHKLLTKLFESGVRQKEFVGELKVFEATEELFALLEAFGFQIALYPSYNPRASLKIIFHYIDSLKRPAL